LGRLTQEKNQHFKEKEGKRAILAGLKETGKASHLAVEKSLSELGLTRRDTELEARRGRDLGGRRAEKGGGGYGARSGPG